MGDGMNAPHVVIINVLFAPNSYGGATIVAEEVAHSLGKLGWQVTAISLISREDLAPYSIIKSSVNGVENFLINVPGTRRFTETYNNPVVSERIAGLLDQLTPDLVHIHCVQDVGAGVIEAAKARNLPVILSVHDFWWICQRQFMITADQRYCGQSPVCLSSCRGCVDNMSDTRSRRNFLFRQASMADCITYPSQFALDLCETSGLAPGSGRVWKNGVRPPKADFFTMQEQRRMSDPRIAFGYLGGPAYIKGWPDIRRAFSDIEREDFKVHLVDGSLDKGWWGTFEASSLPGEWAIHPRFSQAEMDQFYAKIDVLLFMSQWKETFGLAIREAIIRGIEVIQTDSGGTVEHPGVVREKMLPIGSGHKPLRREIEAVLEKGRSEKVPIGVSSFDDQAKQFVEISSRVLRRYQSAA